ncbi:MAG TPA: SDR family NAD(P)-dependent oxidoreductase [Acidimicrobiales bacterium]|nr:SDR family NAD(P)-dependent oxidoreductase [Acidimicrobiales bacterium]
MSQKSPQRVLITGAASGIGRAASLRFAQDGSRLALLDIRSDELNETSDQVRNLGGEVMQFAVDTSQEPEVSAAFAAVKDNFGGLDSVVAAAGISMTLTGDARVDELDKEVWDRILATNLTGTFLTCKYAVRTFIPAGRGSIVVIGSPTGLYGFAYGEHAYSASKAGCHGLARVMAGELGPLGIRVNIVVPGFINTRMNAHIVADRALMDEAEQMIPLRRIGEPAEVAGLIAWLCSDDASYATGGYYAADGGQMCI